ncbi:hypothetical protein FA13DRAFT_1814305 [Coprinellus micaceus]|uniref:Uncharacterized protein n=1 Tax=Coprinellus micaceus TaxID=71717 RepID=A0A4Y7T9P3_COPMI|nr:hypothetical protein FA13DRAFT_1814305 [Coprinellus micaceus]
MPHTLPLQNQFPGHRDITLQKRQVRNFYVQFFCSPLYALIPHLDDFVTWPHFFARKSPIIFPGAPSYFGTSNAMDRIYTVFTAGDVYLEKDPACLQRIVGFVLWGWTQDMEAPVGERETADEYEERVLSRMKVMVRCVQQPVIKDVLLESISLRDDRFHKRLVQSFFLRCQDWTTAHQLQYLEDPRKVEHIVFRMMIEVAVVLSTNGGCLRYLRKFQFPVFVMDLAIKFCHSREARPSRQLTLPVNIAAFFLDRLLGTTYDAVRLVPALLDVGLLQVLFDDLFSHLQGREAAYEWEGAQDKSTPLEMLSRNSHPAGGWCSATCRWISASGDN